MLACMIHPEGCSGHESLCQALETLNLSNCVIVPQKPHAVLTTPQQGWQLLPQSVCDDETSDTWPVMQGENRKPSLPTRRLCKLTRSRAASFFLVPGPLCGINKIGVRWINLQTSGFQNTGGKRIMQSEKHLALWHVLTKVNPALNHVTWQ